MTEGEARDWITTRHGASGADLMERIVALVLAENQQQNLVAPSTLPSIWTRHIVDSAQLLTHAEPSHLSGSWIDVGSGAGFPGLVIAALAPSQSVYLVEPRRKRADFLQNVVEVLDLAEQVTVVPDRIQTLSGVTGSVISARAVAPIADLFSWSAGSFSKKTRWILPKGQSAREDVASARKSWHGVFHVEHSITDPQSLIVVASEVARR